MAADQRRKRVNGASVAGCSSLKQYGKKKRKLESPHKGLNSKSHISLEWDGNKKKVVARKEQIGITRRNLRPFIDSVPGSHNALVDVFSIPQDIFELENLSEVLSYEVSTCLIDIINYSFAATQYSELQFFCTHFCEICYRFGRLSYQKTRESFLCSFFLVDKMQNMSCKHYFLGIIFTLEILFSNGKY